MKSKPNFFARVSCGCIATLSLGLSLPDAHAQSVWTGGTDSVFSTGTNFTPNITNTAVSNLNIQFNGSDATTTDLTLATAFGGGANGAGSAISVLTAQANALTITGSGTAAIRLNASGLSVQAGAGAVTLAGTGNLVIGGLASPTSHSISNLSSNLLDLGSWGFISGGGGTRSLTVEASASGNIVSNGNWSNSVSPLPSTNPLSLTKTGAGKLTLGGTNTVTGNTLVSAGILELTNSLALQNSALDTSGAGTVTVTGPTTLTIGGLTGSTNLASVITTGYSGITSLTLNPLSGTQTYTGAIANGASGMNLVKTGGGIQVLSGTNTYTGTTSASGGRLRLGSADALGATSKVIVTGASGGIGAAIGNFDLAGFTPATAIALELNSGANTNDVGAFYNSSSTAVTYSGAVELKSSTMVGAGNIELTGGFTGGGFSLNKNGLSTLSITNGGTTNLNDLKANRGVVQVNAGTTLNVATLDIGTGTDVGGGLTLNGGSVTSAGLSRFGQGVGVASGTLTLNGGTLTVPSLTKGTRTFNANFNGGTLKASGDSAAFFSSATIARVQAGGARIDDGGFAITIGQALVHDTALDTPSVTADGGLTKLGGGTLTLSGTNTYTGATIIKEGTLSLTSTGTIANSGNLIVGDAGSSGTVLDVTAKTGGFTIGSSQKLSGIGTVDANDGTNKYTVSLAGGAIHAVGNSAENAGVGKQTIDGNLAYGAGSIFEWNLNGNTADSGDRGIAGGYDAVDGTGTLTVDATEDTGTIFRIVLGTEVDLGEGFWDTPHTTHTWSNIFSGFSGLTGGFDTSNIEVTGQSVDGIGSFTINGSSLTWTAVPEPTSALVGLLITAGLLRRRRSA